MGLFFGIWVVACGDPSPSCDRPLEQACQDAACPENESEAIAFVQTHCGQAAAQAGDVRCIGDRELSARYVSLAAVQLSQGEWSQGYSFLFDEDGALLTVEINVDDAKHECADSGMILFRDERLTCLMTSNVVDLCPRPE